MVPYNHILIIETQDLERRIKLLEGEKEKLQQKLQDERIAKDDYLNRYSFMIIMFLNRYVTYNYYIIYKVIPAITNVIYSIT